MRTDLKAILKEANVELSPILFNVNIDEKSLNSALNTPEDATERAYRLTEASIVLMRLMAEEYKVNTSIWISKLAIILFENHQISIAITRHNGRPPERGVKDRIEDLLSRYAEYAEKQYGGLDEWEVRHLADARKYLAANAVRAAQISFQIAMMPELGRG